MKILCNRKKRIDKSAGLRSFGHYQISSLHLLFKFPIVLFLPYLIPIRICTRVWSQGQNHAPNYKHFEKSLESVCWKTLLQVSKERYANFRKFFDLFFIPNYLKYLKYSEIR